MAIVLNLSADGALGSYSDLIAALRDRQDNDAYDGAAIAREIRLAEAFFMRELRVADMEVSETLAVTAATASLPTACRELRSVVWQGSGGDYPLDQMSLSALADHYGGQTGAEPYAYAREGSTLRFAPVASGTARIVYYADLLPLTDANPSNWLLESAPDLYVAGAQYYLCRRERDDNGADKALQEMTAIIASINDEAARKAGGNLIPQGIRQVCGGRG